MRRERVQPVIGCVMQNHERELTTRKDAQRGVFGRRLHPGRCDLVETSASNFMRLPHLLMKA